MVVCSYVMLTPVDAHHVTTKSIEEPIGTQTRIGISHLHTCIQQLEVFQEHIPRAQDSIAGMAQKVGTECGCMYTDFCVCTSSYDVMAL